MKKKPSLTSLVDFANGRLTPEESLEILDHLEKDSEASKELETIARVLNYVEKRGDEEFAAGARATSAHAIGFRNWGGLFNHWKLPSPAFSLVVILLFLAGVVVASRLTTSPYYELTSIGPMEFESLERGPGAEDFAVAQRRFAERRYDDAIRVLERFTRALPNSPGVDYAHYCAGAACLVSARQSILTLFPWFDRDRVSRGMEHLEKAIEKSSNLRIVEESRFMRAKGFLMLGRPSEAVEELEKAKIINGAKREEATELIARIRKF